MEDIMVDWSQVTKGCVVSLVATVVVVDNGSHMLQDASRNMLRFRGAMDLPDAASQVVLLKAIVTETQPITLSINEQSRVFPMKPCKRSEMNQVTELCAGLGGLSSTWNRAGFNVKLAVDINGCWQPLFRNVHPDDDAEWLTAEAGSDECVGLMLTKG